MTDQEKLDEIAKEGIKTGYTACEGGLELEEVLEKVFQQKVNE